MAFIHQPGRKCRHTLIFLPLGEQHVAGRRGHEAAKDVDEAAVLELLVDERSARHSDALMTQDRTDRQARQIELRPRHRAEPFGPRALQLGAPFDVLGCTIPWREVMQ